MLSNNRSYTEKSKNQIQMMHLSFPSIILGLLLFMPSALAHQDDKTARKGLISASNQGFIVSSREEFVHIANINMGKQRLQGRKMAESGKEFGKDDNQQRKNSELSGKSHEASKRSLERTHRQADDQLKALKAEQAAVKPKQSQDSTTLPSLKGSPRSDNGVSQELDNGDDQTIDSQRLLVATREIVNMMNKDYRGMPRRKPPINNHEPRH